MSPSVMLMILGAMCLAGTLIYISHRQWISVWRGHRIRLHQFKIIVEMDDEPVLVESQGVFHGTHQKEWTHPDLGTKTSKVMKIQKGLNVSLEIGDEIILEFAFHS